MKKIQLAIWVVLLVNLPLWVVCQPVSTNVIQLKSLKQLATVDERFQSFNVEMCEVIGGDFWIPYALVDSVRKHSGKKGFDALKWKIDPINLYDKKLRLLAAALGPTYVRVSGTWANAVYFQDDDLPRLDNPPPGFRNILTRPQWKGVIDFCKAVDGKLVTSFSISDGMRDKDGNWTPTQVEALLNYTKRVGGDIAAAEMFNEPSHASHGDAPRGYTGRNYASDFTLFKRYIAQKAPQLKVLGPGSTGEGGILPSGLDIPVDSILSALPRPVFDVFTYHFYGTVSRRCLGGQKPENALSHDWLSKTEKGLAFYQTVRDTYMPGVPIWNTETAEAACGGNPWATTYLDSFRYLEQLGRLAQKGVQVVMHNTLARSEYALLDHDTHTPRPNYWMALLWNRLMGTRVYESAAMTEGVDVFVHSLKHKPAGRTALVLNTTATETSVTIPADARQYLLTADELMTKTVKLNGRKLSLTPTNELPVLKGQPVKAGNVLLPAHSILFLTFEKL